MMKGNIDKEVLHAQLQHWEKNYFEDCDMFGENPSDSAIKVVEVFKKKGVVKILELGGGQGRDTIFFAQNGFEVYVLDYSEIGIKAIKQKAQVLGLSKDITAIRHDARDPFPFNNETFDACYSNMLFCMAFTNGELEFIFSETSRILKIHGLNIYTARNTSDPHYGKGIHRGEDMYEVNGFIVHFFSKEKVQHLAKGFEITQFEEFEECELPRKLFRVTLKKESNHI